MPEATADSIFVCDCAETMRSACKGEAFYKEHDGKYYCILHYPGMEKKKVFQTAIQRKVDGEDFDFRGVWFPDEISFDRFIFNKHASFSSAHFCANADFGGAHFRAGVFFDGARFNSEANFANTQFNSEVTFEGTLFNSYTSFFNGSFITQANFRHAQFSKNVFFINTQFKKTSDFNKAQFNSEADFRDALFNDWVSFEGAVFDASVNFQRTSFLEDSSQPIGEINNKLIGINDVTKTKARMIQISFIGTRFKDGVNFEINQFAEQAFLSFDAATFDKPERATFHSVELRPHWFTNVDSRKFTFINVNWGFLDKQGAMRKEIETLKERGREYQSLVLDITFRQLAVNAEENNRYEEAANFRYMSMEMKRLRRWRKVDIFRLSWWYWLLSGYGERVQRAFGVLLTIWLLFAFLYWMGNMTWWQPKQSSRLAVESSKQEQLPAIAAVPLTFPEALIYSVGVMTLQKPEPLPANKRAKALVLFETILGPLQAALLALAIRRKFMR
jgi:uncharacterized protein YjbI with pentapeptide repeats